VTDLMYTIGSQVVHPCYGAGTIVRIQEKSIGDTSNAYYVINTLCRSMQVMVPVDRAADVGLRYVGKVAELRDKLAICCVMPDADEIDSDLRARQADMRERLKSGNVDEVANVVRLLFFMNNRRPLGTIDRQLFEQGKEMLASELALADGMEMTEAMQQLEQLLEQMLAEEE
jgi:CarD family transcriptional regulator